MFSTALLFAACLSAATDAAPTVTVRRGILGGQVDTSMMASGNNTEDSIRTPPPNLYLTTLPKAFWLHPGAGISSTGYVASAGLNVSTRAGYFFSLQGTASGNLRILRGDMEWANSVAFLSGYRVPRSDLFATFALGPAFGDGQDVKRTGPQKECGFMSIGCDGNVYERTEHQGFGAMAQAQVGSSNRFFGFTAQMQLIYFDGLMTLGVLIGLPMGQLY